MNAVASARPARSASTSRARFAPMAGSALPFIGLQARLDRLVVEELREPVLAAALAVEELRLLELRVEVVLGVVPAHLLTVLEPQLRSAQDDRILVEQLTGERLDLDAEIGPRHAPVDETHLRRLDAVERAAGHDVEERGPGTHRLGERTADDAAGRDAPVDLRQPECRLVGGDSQIAC